MPSILARSSMDSMVSSTEFMKQALHWGVSSIPTLIVFKKGEEVDRITGGMSAEVLEEKIKAIK